MPDLISAVLNLLCNGFLYFPLCQESCCYMWGIFYFTRILIQYIIKQFHDCHAVWQYTISISLVSMKCLSHTPFNAANAPVLYSCPLNPLLLLFYFPFYFRIHWSFFLDLIGCFSSSTLYSFPLISSSNFFTFLLLFHFLFSVLFS